MPASASTDSNAAHGEPSNGVRESSPPPALRSWGGLVARLARGALLRPTVLLDLIALAWAFRAWAWYRKAPFLPVPPPEYIRWRMMTAYGDEDAIPPVEDVLRFARWRRDLLRS